MVLWLKILVLTVLVPGTLAVWVPWEIAGDRPFASGLAGVLGVALLGAGLAIYIWCVYDFATFGRGTPAPFDPPKALVIRGLYHSVRNPMYLGVVSVIESWALLFRSGGIALYGLVVFAGFHLFVVLYEEPTLAQTFGEPYDRYRSQVGRWLPRVRRGPRV